LALALAKRFATAVLLIGVAPAHIWGETASQSTDELIAAGIERGYNFDRSAFELFDEVIRREPQNPRGYFLKAAGFFWYSLVNPADASASTMTDETAP